MDGAHSKRLPESRARRLKANAPARLTTAVAPSTASAMVQLDTPRAPPLAVEVTTEGIRAREHISSQSRRRIRVSPAQ